MIDLPTQYSVDATSTTWDKGVGDNIGMGSANERRRYNVTPSLIGRALNQDDHWGESPYIWSEPMRDNVTM